MNKTWYLSQINLLEELPMEDLEMIDAMAPMSQVAKGTLIISPDRENQNLYFLKQGRVRLFKVNEDGKEFTIGILGKGNIFGETETFSTGSGRVYVETMDDTLICLLGKRDLEKLIVTRPQVALKLVSILTQRIRESEEMLENLAFRDVRTRVLYLLAKLARTFGTAPGLFKNRYTKLDLHLSHQEIANMIGATRESVSMALSQLAKEAFVSTGRRSIAVDVMRAEKELHDH